MQEINFYIAPVLLGRVRERGIMNSQCIVPNWNLSHQRQEQVGEEEEGNRCPHVQPQQNLTYVVPVPPDYKVTELTWENGQLGLHGLNLPPPTKHHHHHQSWPAKPRDTLESIVHQATFPQPSTTAGKYFPTDNNNNDDNNSNMADENWEFENAAKVDPNFNNNAARVVKLTNSNNKWRELKIRDEQKRGKLMMSSNNMGAAASSGGGKWSENSGGGLGNKRVRSESERSGCASAAIFREATDATTTMMTSTWGSFESPGSTNLKSVMNTDDDSTYNYQDCSENQDGERMTKGESFRSQSSARRSRAAVIHNLSERRRRDRINEKMKALQKLVPNASKTDKASMLDEVIEYLKQLQAQVHMMSNARNMPQMMMPLGMQQQIQMSLLARMGMGMSMGMGMLDVNNLARNSFSPLIHTTTPLGGTTTSFVSPPFAMPQVVPPPPQLKANIGAANINASVPNFNDAYNTFIAQQSMNMDFLNKMSALYRQQTSQPSKKPVSSSLPNDGQGE